MGARFALQLFLFFALFNSIGKLYAQNIVYGTNRYVEYQEGTLPIILSVPHGGAVTPASIPDRTCFNATTVTDAFTIETAKAIQQAMYNATGCFPHLVICNLKRTKLDCNRAIEEAACKNAEAEKAWQEYHAFLVQAREQIYQMHGDEGLFIDLHGHGHPIPRIELGYRLTSADLELTDSVLNLPRYTQKSSLRLLALNNENNFSHAQLLRGEYAIGSLLGALNYPSVPSQQIPSPGIDEPYFNGGYNTATHTCAHPDVRINGWQMELNFTGIRNNNTNRTAFANAFTQAILQYATTHFNVDWTLCSAVAVSPSVVTSGTTLNVFPNPSIIGSTIHLQSISPSFLSIHVFNAWGCLQFSQTIAPHKNWSTTFDQPGIYFLHCSDHSTGQAFTKKLLVTGNTQ